MEPKASFSFKTPLNEWRNYLQDINFWLDGYLESPAYRDLEQKLNWFDWVMWNVGVGPTACFTRAISSITRDVKIKRYGPYDHVIEVDMKQAAAQLAGTSLSINDKLHLKVAQQLGLLHQDQEQDYSRLEEKNDELRYYAYNTTQAGAAGSLLEMLHVSALIQITQKLSTKKYMLVVENLDEPINPIKLSDLTEGLWLPPPRWAPSFWLVSTTSQYVYDKSNPDYGCVVESFTGDDILILTLYSLKQAAKYISRAVGQHEDEEYWHRVAIQCFHYATMLLIPHSSKVDNNPPDQFVVPDDVNSNKLIRHWASQGILPVIRKQGIPDTADSKYNGDGDGIYQVGNVILEAFREYSLLHLPSSPAKQGDEATKTAAHFLAYHGLIAEHLKLDALCEDNNQLDLLECTQWISHVGDQGWCLSREWLRRQGSSGPTALIIKHCSKQTKLFMKLESDHFFAKLPCLRLLDLSYTPIKSLPPSICYLQELQYLSLRGCYNLTSPFSFPNTEITHLSEINSSKKNLNLLCFDLSYSNINAFHSDFFYSMPYLQALFLVKCSNLEELPPSVASLSSVEKLELTGTQIKSFPGKMFEEMKKLGSVKIIDNKELTFAPAGLFSKASRLMDLHIEGCESITEVEVTLERHPSLRSFSFIGAPHMKRLSLHGCRKLEYVDIKEVGALEELDLSATAIKELTDSIPNLPQLRRLLLLGVPSLRRFPWHRLQRLPDVFCLDQCSNSTINHSDHPQGAQACISDSRLFYSFNDATQHLVRARELLRTFYVRVTSCKATSSKLKDEEDMVMINKVQMAPPAYADVNRLYLTDGVSMVSMDDVPPCRVSERHVEISAADRYPHGLKHLLKVTKSISMWDDTHVPCLSDLSELDELEECKLRWCRKTVQVFKRDYYFMMRNMKNAFVSHLKSLTHFHRPSDYSYPFYALKHLVLEHCPRLDGVVPRDCELRSLETLDILFCYNLKAIFYNNGYSSSRGFKLPCLRRIRLQELPLLEHLHVDNPMLTAPAWKELHVRGCWSLHRLPRFRRQPDKAVKVSGERAWWANLSWDQDNNAPPHRDSYEPRLAPTFASHRERVVIESYLR